MPLHKNIMQGDSLLTDNDVKKFKDWFVAYVQSFLTGCDRSDSPFLLRRDHTFRVRENMRMLGGSVGLSEKKMLIAETAALFHDVGRFRQYREYGTFRDSLSVNHAHLGLRVLGQHRILSPCSTEEKRAVAGAVAWHNALSVPATVSGFRRKLLLLLRDADKLDNWKVAVKYYQGRQSELDEGLALRLPDTGNLSEAAVKALGQGQMVRTQDIRVLNDFKLLQIGWIYDLNFQESFRTAHNRGFIEAIAKTLPDNEKVRAAVARARDYLICNLQPE